MNKRFAVAGLFVLACGTATADPVEEYRRACEAPHSDIFSTWTHPGDRSPFEDAAAWSAAEESCAAFVRWAEADDDPSPEARLALFMARDWLGGYPEKKERCAEVGEIVERLPDNADALYEWSRCIGGDVSYALMHKAAEMGHQQALLGLVRSFAHTGEYPGGEGETLARHAAALYAGAGDVYERYLAAKAIYKIARDTGDADAAKAIQGRLVHDHGLDSLDYDPAHRVESLERACDGWMFDLDLEERLCVPALEALAADSLARGEAIPRDVLLRMGEAFEESEAKAWFAGGANRAGERIAAILVSHPETVRSSEHLRVLAETTPRGSPERIAGLRRAVEADSGNLRARCGLADALALTGVADIEAAALYKGVLAAEHPPCAAGDALRRLEEGAVGGAVETIHLR